MKKREGSDIRKLFEMARIKQSRLDIDIAVEHHVMTPNGQSELQNTVTDIGENENMSDDAASYTSDDSIIEQHTTVTLEKPREMGLMVSEETSFNISTSIIRVFFIFRNITIF